MSGDPEDWREAMLDVARILVQAGLTTFEVAADLFRSFSDELDRDIPDPVWRVEYVMDAIEYARDTV